MLKNDHMSAESWRKSREVLGVGESVTEADLRTAYLAKVRLHPPDRDPERFEQIRDAFNLLRDPDLRVQRILYSDESVDQPLAKMVEQQKPARKFVGPGPWLEVLKERRS